jgi:DNA-binding LacI/PurR family transcriptional regulator
MGSPAPRERERPPTIKDVARTAKVGVGTVSRVLNDSPMVSEDVRRRVLQTIEELGYRRSSTARNLSLGRTQTVGVVAPFFTSASVLERLRGVVEQLRLAGEYDLLMFDVESLAQRADAFRQFARNDRVDGLIVISLLPSAEEVEMLRREGLSVVLVDVVHPAFPHVVIDDVAGGELATEHLLGKGHRRIGFVGDAPSPFGFTSSEDRRKGMRRALRRAGIPSLPELEQRGPYGRAEARGMAERLLRLPDPPSAIFAASDFQAMGVLEAASALGLRVPEDLAVIGFDDIELAGAMGLTTVRQPLRETGTLATAMLIAAVERTAPLPTAELEPLAVVERRTT